jgi:pimeloyl-ACP methyl ester carboxylesterase
MTHQPLLSPQYELKAGRMLGHYFWETTMTTTTSSEPLDRATRPTAVPWRTRLLRLSLRALIAIVALAGVGLVYQAAGTLLDQRMYPPPGQRIDVGGFRMHLYCLGTNMADRPTVILDTLSGGTTPIWAWLQPEVAQATRVCAYDRAGWGWSDDGPAPRDARQTARELHNLTAQAGLDGPYVLVGHSLGGLFVRQYAADYPDEVVGLVLIDASHPDQAARLPVEALEMDRTMTRLFPVLSALNHLGVSRLAFALGAEFDFGELPPEQRAQTKAFWSSPRRWDTMRQEAAVRLATDAQIRASGDLGNLPLAVVTAGDGSPPSWLALQADLVSLSSNSIHVIVAGATHASLVIDPEAARVTSGAILQVVEAARSGAPVTAR